MQGAPYIAAQIFLRKARQTRHILVGNEKSDKSDLSDKSD